MKNFHLERIFNVGEVEAYFLREKYLAKPLYCMILIDYQRASTLDDFPEFKGFREEEDFGVFNFVRAIIITREELDEKSEEEVIEVPSGFLENKSDCHWKVDFEIEPEFSDSRDEILSFIQTLLQKYGCSIDVTNIPEHKFNFLSQK